MKIKLLFLIILLAIGGSLSPQTHTFVALDNANPWTALQIFNAGITSSGQITSTVATGTAPMSIASTTVVQNLNAQLHGGLAAPASAILGLTDTQSPTNKTFDISLNTLKTATNTAGHYPRNNGTQYVDTTIAAADVPAGTACGANNFANGINAGLAPACAQPAFSNLSGNIATSQMNSGTGASSSTFWRGDGSWASAAAVPTVTLKKGNGSSTYSGTNSGSFASVDTTNLCLSVTVPTGSKLVVAASGNLTTLTSGVTSDIALGDTGSSCANAPAATPLVEQSISPTAAGVNFAESFSLNWVVTGDGAVHSISLQAQTSNASDAWQVINTSGVGAAFIPTMVFVLETAN